MNLDTKAPTKLTSKGLHATARRRLDPMLSHLGFGHVRETSMAAWVREEGSQWLILWFQPMARGEPYAPGFRFTVELRLGDQPVMFAPGHLARLPQLLSAARREELRTLDNRALAKVPRPSVARLAALPEAIRASVEAEWRPRVTPFGPDEHVWLRATDEGDLTLLLEFIARELPEAIGRFLDAVRAAEPRQPRSAPST
jgi:hypothetical protein